MSRKSGSSMESMGENVCRQRVGGEVKWKRSERWVGKRDGTVEREVDRGGEREQRDRLPLISTRLIFSVLPVHAATTSSHSINSALSPSITHSLFHSRLKTYLFHKPFPP